MSDNNTSYPTNIWERIKHLWGSHTWVVDYFGDGFPMRECQICGLCEVKPGGSNYFLNAGEGTTLQSTRELYERLRSYRLKHYDSSPKTKIGDSQDE